MEKLTPHKFHALTEAEKQELKDKTTKQEHAPRPFLDEALRFNWNKDRVTQDFVLFLQNKMDQHLVEAEFYMSEDKQAKTKELLARANELRQVIKLITKGK